MSSTGLVQPPTSWLRRFNLILRSRWTSCSDLSRHAAMLQDCVDDVEWQSWQQVLATLLQVGRATGWQRLPKFWGR